MDSSGRDRPGEVAVFVCGPGVDHCYRSGLDPGRAGEGRSIVAEKTIESVRVEVDEAALAPLGWTAQDVRARLVTETRSGGMVVQQVAVAGTVRFRTEDWADRFSETRFAPHVLVALNRRGATSLPSFGKVVAERAEVAAKRPIRFTETSHSWIGPARVTPEQLEVRLTGYDLDSIQHSLSLPADQATALPVTVLDESTWPSLQVKAQATAEITRPDDRELVQVRVEGIVEPGPVEQLLADRETHPVPLLDRLLDVPQVAVPGFVVEVADDSDFLLAKQTIKIGGAITVDEATGGPRRGPRFVADFRTNSASYAGTPAQVTLRILDAAEVRSI
ncbi:hypothetical protein [Actinoplanes aureus]|uniref:Uncharacterized protein n=1 Tax=Actinoplanes aureus TaxID=2792083 RepID=A0A931CJC3_9ACTN|nr:hypothetical protein [Actinoplanes aureus]MBG0568176.1 hypothetical protein [Actinoplanes aureus]